MNKDKYNVVAKDEKSDYEIYCEIYESTGLDAPPPPPSETC